MNFGCGQLTTTMCLSMAVAFTTSAPVAAQSTTEGDQSTDWPPVTVQATRAPRAMPGPDVFQRAITREAGLARSTAQADASLLLMQAQGAQSRSWAKRHPVLIGTLVGFGAGYGLGLGLGQGGGIQDWSAGFSGLVFGGVGAATGAVIGRLIEPR